jgi:opacity protein-like surface antigen
MRKFIAAAAVAATFVAAPAFAAAEPGVYLGLGATYDNVVGTQSAEGLGVSGLGGTVFAGYNLPLGNNVFTGIEGNFDLSTADAGDQTNGAKAVHQYGATARLGYNLSNGAAAYVRAGYQRGRAAEYIGGTRFAASRDGLLLGAGVEANLTEKVALRVGFDHTIFYRDKAVDPAGFGLANNKATFGVIYGF